MLINKIVFCYKVQGEHIDSIIFEVPKLFILQGSPYLVKTEVFTHNVEFLLSITDNSVISRHVLHLVDVCDEL